MNSNAAQALSPAPSYVESIEGFSSETVMVLNVVPVVLSVDTHSSATQAEVNTEQPPSPQTVAIVDINCVDEDPLGTN